MVTGGMKFEPPVIRSFDAVSIETGTVIARPETIAGGRRLVGSGRELDGQDVHIVDPQTCESLPPGRVGEIWVSGPSVAQGYWNRPDETAATFAAMLAQADAQAGAGSVTRWRPTAGPYMRTGDLGFFDNGELFVTGRLKDLIIIRGRNHYPQDIEHAVEEATPLVRAGSIAAFAVDVDGRERVCVVAELERGKREPAEIASAFEAIRKRLATEHEVAAEAIVFVRPNSVPKTSSGKIQRHACKRQFLDGTLEVVEQHVGWLQPQAAPVTAAARRFPAVGAGPASRRIGPRPAARPRAAAGSRADGVRSRPPGRQGACGQPHARHEHRRGRARSCWSGWRSWPACEEAFGGRFPEQVLPQIETCREVAEAIIDHMPADGRPEVKARGSLPKSPPTPIASNSSPRCGRWSRISRWSAMRASRIPISASTKGSPTTAR